MGVLSSRLEEPRGSMKGTGADGAKWKALVGSASRVDGVTTVVYEQIGTHQILKDTAEVSVHASSTLSNVKESSTCI